MNCPPPGCGPTGRPWGGKSGMGAADTVPFVKERSVWSAAFPKIIDRAMVIQRLKEAEMFALEAQDHSIWNGDMDVALAAVRKERDWWENDLTFGSQTRTTIDLARAKRVGERLFIEASGAAGETQVQDQAVRELFTDLKNRAYRMKEDLTPGQKWSPLWLVGGAIAAGFLLSKTAEVVRSLKGHTA